jgi:hypothetical protein
MIEFTFAELWLLAWAILATVGFFNAKHEARAARTMLKAMIESKEIRDGIVAKYEEMERNATQ